MHIVFDTTAIIQFDVYSVNDDFYTHKIR